PYAHCRRPRGVRDGAVTEPDGGRALRGDAGPSSSRVVAMTSGLYFLPRMVDFSSQAPDPSVATTPMTHALEPMPDLEATSQPRPLKVFMITSEWPTMEHPEWSPFLVRQVEFLRGAGVQVDVYAFRGAKNPWSYLRAWQVAQQRMRAGNYDLVHAQW